MPSPISPGPTAAAGGQPAAVAGRLQARASHTAGCHAGANGVVLHLRFNGGPLDGLKLIGFAVWERRAGGRNVTFPARQYSVNGERRSFALLRPVTDAAAQERLRDVILDAYREHEAAVEAATA